LSRENTLIRYAALVLAIGLVGSILVGGLATAKTPASGATDKVLLKVKNPQTVAKNPNQIAKAIVLKPTPRTKAVVKPSVKPTATIKRKMAIKPTISPTVKTKAVVKPSVKPTATIKTKP